MSKVNSRTRGASERHGMTANPFTGAILTQNIGQKVRTFAATWLQHSSMSDHKFGFLESIQQAANASHRLMANMRVAFKCFYFFRSLPASDHTPFLPNMIQVLVAEMLDAGGDGAYSRVTQGTEALAADVVADVQEKVNVLFEALAVLDAVHDLVEPIGALAAGDALATGFVAVELGQPLHQPHDTRPLADDDDRPRAQHGASRSDGLVVQGQRVQHIGGQHGRGGATRDDRFDRSAGAASVIVDQGHHRYAQRQLVDAWLVDVAADAEEL